MTDFNQANVGWFIDSKTRADESARVFGFFYQPSFAWLILIPGPMVDAITQLLIY